MGSCPGWPGSSRHSASALNMRPEGTCTYATCRCVPHTRMVLWHVHQQIVVRMRIAGARRHRVPPVLGNDLMRSRS